MKSIVLLPNPTRDSELSVTAKIAERLLTHDVSVYIEKSFADFMPSGVIAYTDIPTEVELLIVTGGDGSVIDASVIAIEKDIPIIGVNLGKVGYLSEIDPKCIEVIDRLFTGEYKIVEKMLLQATHVSGEREEVSDRLAVNDVIISHDTFLGIAEVSLENSSGDHVRYRADGMILSTPVGSTAYSLSAGGPIIAHDVDSIVATPICPHSFFNRSIVFSENEVIRLKNTGNPSLNVSIDGRFFATLTTGEECVVQKASKKIKILTFNNNNMFEALFKKMRNMEGI